MGTFITTNRIRLFEQGIIDYTETETLQIFYHMLTIAKTFEELFTPILNGIAVSVLHAWVGRSVAVAGK